MFLKTIPRPLVYLVSFIEINGPKPQALSNLRYRVVTDYLSLLYGKRHFRQIARFNCLITFFRFIILRNGPQSKMPNFTKQINVNKLRKANSKSFVKQKTTK